MHPRMGLDYMIYMIHMHMLNMFEGFYQTSGMVAVAPLQKGDQKLRSHQLHQETSMASARSEILPFRKRPV